jgi:hypothetical protein
MDKQTIAETKKKEWTGGQRAGLALLLLFAIVGAIGAGSGIKTTNDGSDNHSPSTSSVHIGDTGYLQSNTSAALRN